MPRRQVYGWIYASEGYVWAGVLIDGDWHSIDPSAAISCGSNYVPLATSVDEIMPLIYASKPEMRVITGP